MGLKLKMYKDIKVIGIPHRIGNHWVYEFISNFKDKDWLNKTRYPIKFSLERYAYNISEDVVSEEYKNKGCIDEA